jgi:capsular exopolysaccharide synthesis family protein
MSRIQDILQKAERDGTLRRTQGAVAGPSGTSAAATLAPPTPIQRVPVEPAPVARHDWADAEPARSPVQLAHQLVAATAPHSLAAEQYRSLRTRIGRAGEGRAIRTLIVTSPAKGDGKSLTAANLALTMAQQFQQRVLLVDADLRQPSIHRLFGLASTPGLSDVLVGSALMNEALVTLRDHHLSVLPAGTLPSQPAELLGSVAMRQTLDRLGTQFDRIVLDMPPAVPLADVQIALSAADAVVMVVRAGVTPKPAIERALAGLDRTKVLGLVLNEYGGADSYTGYEYAAG